MIVRYRLQDSAFLFTNFFRERLHRKQLLIEAHNIEAMQRHRVNNFIKKLDREDELTREAEANVRWVVLNSITNDF